jgi:hypothetical protein
MKEKNKKGGLGCGRLPPYPVKTVSLWCRDAMSVDLLASPSAGATCRGHASSCVFLVPSRMGGMGVRICIERGEVA